MDGSLSRPMPAVTPMKARAGAALTSTAALGAAFVVLWSTGYIAGKIGLGHALGAAVSSGASRARDGCRSVRKPPFRTTVRALKR